MSTLLSSNNFSISVWVNTNVFSGSYHGFIGKQGDSYRKPGMWLKTNSKGLHYDHYSSSGTRYSGTLSNFFSSTNTWFHVVWVKNGTESKFYRNGNYFDTVSSPSQFYNKPSTAYWIGKVDNYWDGIIDEVRIYNRALTALEVASLYKF